LADSRPGSSPGTSDPREIYGPIAELYDELRPGYPDQLFTDIVRLAGTPRDGTILEIGCGPGKATVGLARLGRRIVSVDPVPEMLAVARRNCSGFPNVEFIEGRFEDVPIADGSIDLVIAVQSFHWVEPETGCRKAGTVLRQGGSLVLVWTDEAREDTPLERALRAAYERTAPDRPSPSPGLGARGYERPALQDRIQRTGMFGPVAVHRHHMSMRYSAADWARLQSTMSHNRALPEARRSTMLDEVRSAIEAHGGELRRTGEHIAYLARRL
jgi:SAM-dependent methyltransferase